MFKFIHAADIHLDSPLRGLERYEGAPVERIRGATRQALKNLVELALSERVAFILIAGDVYDGDWNDYNTGLFFASLMSRLGETKTQVFLISGNHDAANKMTRHLRMPAHVKTLSTKRPETVVLEELGVAIHGQGYSKQAVTENLSLSYPQAMPGHFNIGMLHTSATGRNGHETYAPCAEAGLESKGYQYWALGHVHQREVLAKNPWIVFPGNIQGRHIRETGPKGCSLVTVEDSQVASVEEPELDVVRWSLCRVDASDAESADEVVRRVIAQVETELKECGDRALAVRILVSGPCRAHESLSTDEEGWVNEIRNQATDAGRGRVWIEKVKFQTSMLADFAGAVERDDAFGGLLRAVQSVQSAETALASIKDELASFLQKLPLELRRGEEAIDLDRPEKLRELCDDLKQILIQRLLSQKKTP